MRALARAWRGSRAGAAAARHTARTRSRAGRGQEGMARAARAVLARGVAPEVAPRARRARARACGGGERATPWEGPQVAVPRNVLGGELECCCANVRGTGIGTGFYRDGFCSTGADDVGRCAVHPAPARAPAPMPMPPPDRSRTNSRTHTCAHAGTPCASWQPPSFWLSVRPSAIRSTLL